MAGTGGSRNGRNDGHEQRERIEMAGEDKQRTSKKGKLALAQTAAAIVALVLLGLMASSALADGDPFAAITAITGTSTSSDTTGASSTSSDTTGATTDATTSDTTTTDANATTTDTTPAPT